MIALKYNFFNKRVELKQSEQRSDESKRANDCILSTKLSTITHELKKNYNKMDFRKYFKVNYMKRFQNCNKSTKIETNFRVVNMGQLI